MTLLAKDSGGENIVAREQIQPRFYPPATTHPAAVEIYMRLPDQPPESDQLVGIFKPGESNSIPYNPDFDQNATFSTKSISPSGVPSETYRADAVQATLIHQRETEAPIIGQVGEATPDKVVIGISNFTAFARKRRIRIADNPDMENPIEIIIDYERREIPKYFELMRETTAILDSDGLPLLDSEGGYILDES